MGNEGFDAWKLEKLNERLKGFGCDTGAFLRIRGNAAGDATKQPVGEWYPKSPSRTTLSLATKNSE
jgi:hypothetical protein